MSNLTEDQKKFISDLGHKMISDEELDKYMDDQLNLALESLKDGLIGRMIVVGMKKEDGKPEMIFMMFADFPEPKTRHKAFQGIGAKLAERPGFIPMAVILTTEAWTKQFDKDEIEKRDKMVSEYDDKKEVIIVAAMTMDKRQKTIVVPITRDKDDKIITGEKTTMDDTENYLLAKVFEGFALAKFAKGEK